MDKVSSYISELYQNSNIIRKEQYEKDTSFKFYCPVIDTSVAEFFNIFIKSIKPQKVLELGTSIGYSTTIIANAIRDYGGEVTTIEFDDKVAKAAVENFVKYGVDKNINLVNGDAKEILPKLNTKYDFIFLDLYNGIYPDVVDKCIDLLNQGGVMIADDTLFPVIKHEKMFEESNKKMQIFNESIANNNCVYSYLLPLDDGITIIIKK